MIQTKAQLNDCAARAQLGANGPLVYTHQLPYGIRQHICNLLDADQSWRLLGGQCMRLDATQLRLVGQALLRNDSPTGELLNKLDSANVRVSELFDYLSHMGHCRATQILKPYVIDERQAQQQQQQQQQEYKQPNGNYERSLDTPTPSFSSIQPMAIMSSAELGQIAPADYQNQNPDEWKFVDSSSGRRAPPAPAPRRCHDSEAAAATAVAAAAARDPGDEIVRLACANNRKRTSISDEEVVNQLRLIMQITYNELKQASDDFAHSNILGNGGFASVYRGSWKGTDVAIKRLRCNLMDQALNELTILNSYRIDNILPIYGISIDGPEACLVYQFMANGSLEDRLSCKGGTRALSWRQRAQIAEGVAKGLYYLHTLRDKPLVHGDAKSANVLLDSQFVPKLGDFGLARQVFKGKNPQAEHCTHCTVSSIHGTSVYLPPEYLRHKILSPAVDVYSYGVVLLELATGRRAYDGKRLLIDLVEDELRAAVQRPGGQPSASLSDARLPDSSQAELRICFELLLRLGFNCAHRIKKKRPHMGQVLHHFAHFRLGGGGASSEASGEPMGPAVAPIDAHLIMSGLAATPPSAATTRTLTPDLNVQPANCNASAGAPFQPLRAQLGPKSVEQRHSSNLMSVEEEFELLNQMGGQPMRTQTCGAPNNHQAEQQIEAMIPLLTELGFSPSQVNSGEQAERADSQMS